MTPMSLTNQPAVPIDVQFQISGAVGLPEDVAVMAGSREFRTDVPYEGLCIHYDLDIYGMPVLPIMEHVLCLMGGAVVPHGYNQWPRWCVGIWQCDRSLSWSSIAGPPGWVFEIDFPCAAGLQGLLGAHTCSWRIVPSQPHLHLCVGKSQWQENAVLPVL